MRKSDVLFLIVGTNPMPNIISIINRVKEDGKVFLIHSREKNKELLSTEKIADDLRNILKERYPKLIIEKIVVNIQSEESMIQEVKNKLPEQSDLTIELNCTGGTKLMASTIYGYFKGLMRSGSRDIIISYLDCEKDSFIFEEKQGSGISFSEKKVDVNIYNKVNLIDIIKSHGLRYHDNKKTINFEEASYEMFYKFERKSVEEKKEWIAEFNIILDDKENTRELLSKFLSKQIESVELEEICKLEDEKFVRYAIGENLEEYLFKILTDLKDEDEIDNFIWSYEQKKNKSMAGTEIDFIIGRGTKNYLLSVTLCEKEYECKPKLYEAKTRGEQILGDEARIGFICLYDSFEKLGHLIDANDKYSKDLVIAVDNFCNIKNKLKEWVRR